MKRTRATSDYTPHSRSNTNNAAPWAIAALAAGLTIGYFCMKPKTPTTNTNIHMQQEVTIQNSHQTGSSYDTTTATPYQPTQVQRRPATTVPSTQPQAQPSLQTTPAARQSIDGVVDETISPEEMRAMEANGSLINEWKGVKQYDDTQVDPDVVDHHYKTRGMSTVDPCNNK